MGNLLDILEDKVTVLKDKLDRHWTPTSPHWTQHESY